MNFPTKIFWLAQIEVIFDELQKYDSFHLDRSDLFGSFLNCGDKSEKPVETTSAPIATETASTLSPELQKGQEIFLQNCSSCHGEKGAGDGAAAASLNPKPRNYKAPASQWKTEYRGGNFENPQQRNSKQPDGRLQILR